MTRRTITIDFTVTEAEAAAIDAAAATVSMSRAAYVRHRALPPGFVDPSQPIGTVAEQIEAHQRRRKRRAALDQLLPKE